MKVFSYSSDDIGVIAQLGERLNGIQEVRSSILLSSTNSKKPSQEGGFLLQWGCSSVGMAKRKDPWRGVFVCNILAALPRKGSGSNRNEVRHPRRMVPFAR